MAGKFMKIKRLVIPFISLVILTSQLTGCAMMSQADIETELANGTEIELEIAEPESYTGKDEVEIDGGRYIIDTAYGATEEEDSEDPEVGVIENLGVLEDEPEEAPEIIEVTIVEGQELHDIFQHVYDSDWAARRYIDTLDSELRSLERISQGNYNGYSIGENKRLPDDYEEQYKAWRPVEKVAEDPSVSNAGSSGQHSNSGSGSGSQNTAGNSNGQQSTGGQTTSNSSTGSQDSGSWEDNPYYVSPEEAGVVPEGWSSWTQEQKDAYNRELMDRLTQELKDKGITVGG